MLLDCKSAQLENLVAIELVRRYGMENVFYFENNVVYLHRVLMVNNS
jgi:predicted AAA+ superfamily ATPase